jgi:hypothetical protein
MVKTLRAYRSGILAYYDFPISTGPLEGTNNKIKTMKRQAYGFRGMEFFNLKIVGLQETKYALVSDEPKNKLRRLSNNWLNILACLHIYNWRCMTGP